VKTVRLAVVVVVAAVAFVAAAALVAANARPEPGPCNDTAIVELQTGSRQVGRSQTAPICAAPEAPGWLVVAGGAVAAGAVVAGYVLLARGRSGGRRRVELVA